MQKGLTMTQRMCTGHDRRLRSLMVVFVSASLLLAVSMCSLTPTMSGERHDGGHGTDPSHHNEETSEGIFCCTSLVCILPTDIGSDVLSPYARFRTTHRDQFLPVCTSGSCAELRAHIRSLCERGPPFYLQTQFPSTPCGLRAPPGRLCV